MTALAKIEAIDETLKTLTEAWKDAAPEKAEKWRVKIDEVLDSRIEQMAIRDSAAWPQ
jgi:ElaB/YqjD/DUF883 family membrane-anchored ribosome-binding protein